MACSCKTALIAGFVVSLAVVIIFAVLGFAILPGVIEDQVIDNVILDKKGTDQFDRFEKLPFALNFSVYFFHVNNSKEVFENGAVPIMVEIGPITYKKQQEKKEIVLEGTTIKYDNYKNHTFADEYSALKPEDKVTLINVPLVAVAQIMENMSLDLAEGNDFFKVFLSYLIDNIFMKGYRKAFNTPDGSVFHEVAVGDYSFTGYKFCAADDQDIISGILCLFIQLEATESMIPDPKTKGLAFSFFEQKQGKEMGAYEVEQGDPDNMANLANIKMWNGASETGYWNPEGECTKIFGTDSTIYPPLNDKDKVFHVFNTDICRRVELAYDSDIEYAGIDGYRSVVGPKVMDMSLEENQCFCIKESRDINGEKNCLPSGFADMHRCLGAPILLSLPHFLYASDETYTKTVEGLSPSKDEHQIFIDMEPNTGSPMRGHKRVQFNTILRKYKTMDKVKEMNVNPAVIPIMWIDENVYIPDDLVDYIYDKYVTPVTAIDITAGVLIGIGSLGALMCAGYYLYKRKEL